MKASSLIKPSFSILGKEGSTAEGEGFIARLWEEANAHFDEIAALAKHEADGSLSGIYGAMTDFSRSFRPWEGFTEGLYLAGVECRDDALPPPGWTKWTLPSFEYRCIEAETGDAFANGLKLLEAESLSLVGAVQEFTCPRTGTHFLLFPIRKR